MRVLLGRLESATTRRPIPVIAVLLTATVGAGIMASTNEMEVDLTRLGGEASPSVQAMDRIHEAFGEPVALQVILDAGEGGDVFTAEGLAAFAEAEDIAVEVLGSDLRTDGDGEPMLTSLGAAVSEAMLAQDLDPDQAEDAEVAAAAAALLEADPQAAALVSDDAALAEGRARASVMMVELDPELTSAQAAEAGQRLEDAFAGDRPEEPAGFQVTVYGQGLFEAGMLSATRADAPLLFGLALLVVLVILTLAYRSVFDVAIGFLGLVATVLWTLGIAALLGPSHLGLLGPLSQLVVMVPVLLVGLGIDYSVHLTARYREQRGAGQDPAAAAGRALRTVGTALVLATVATAVGFATMATAPLPLLVDFGIVVAIGVCCAFVITALLVPAARVLRDRHRAEAAGRVREIGLGRLVGPVAGLARRYPALGPAVALLLVGGSLAVVPQLETRFDRDDFVPEGSDIARNLDAQAELFGADVTETTLVLVEGDLTDPDVANAVWRAQRELAAVEGVRAHDGDAQARSVVSAAAAVLGAAPQEGGAAPGQGPGGEEPPSGEAPGGDVPPSPIWTGDGFDEGAGLAAVYDRMREELGPERVEAMLTEDDRAALVQIRTTAGDSGAERLRGGIEEAFAAVEDTGARVMVTSEPMIMSDMNADLSRFQVRAIVVTLTVVLVLIAAYYGIAHRRPVLGAIAMVPAVIGASLILGAMWALDLYFNVISATLTAVAVGIGVPYGVHIVNRFLADTAEASADEAVTTTLRNTGGALAGSALTTLGALAVLATSDLVPIRTLGLLGGVGIAFAFLAALLVVPGLLVTWARRRDAREEGTA